MLSTNRLSQGKSKSPSEVRLVEVLDAYLAAAQEGTAPARDELLAEYPELAEDLEACLASLEFIRQASLSAPPLLADSQAVETSEGETGIGDLGDFRLIAEVGRGGMGVVYEAVQRSLNRRVALKVLPFAAAMDPTQLRRFQTEALAAAQLHHTHIVPVYSVGCERGIHYYAMQFIEGQTLAQAIAERRQSATPPPPISPSPVVGEGGPKGRMGGEWDRPDPAAPPSSERDTPAETPAVRSPSPTPYSRTREYFRTAAALGIQAAEALDHAHKFGIVHRDIKPANLLLDIQGNLWITDFGLARLSDDAGLTITGDLLGTLRYMSPEQALAKRGYLDHRTDIYSLGATLYELVTLRPAVDGQDRQEVLRKIAQDEPPPPRRLNPAIPRELETILLKAMNKEPESRYDTAQEMAHDLRRFLENRPIRAKRPSLMERAAKWSRRHRMMVATAFSFLLLAVVTLSTSIVLIARQQREAERQRDEARQAVDDMYTDVAEQWLAQQAALEPVQRTFLQKALAYYQRFAGEQSTDQKVRLNTAVAYRRVGEIERKLGDSNGSEAADRRALAIIEKLAADLPSVPQYQSELAKSHGSLGVLLLETGHHAEAEPQFRRAIALHEKLAAESPSEPRYRSELARSHNHLGFLRYQTGRAREAEQEYRRAIALYGNLVAELPSSAGYQEALAESENNLGLLLNEMGRRVEAEPAYRRTIALLEKLAADSPAVPQYRRSLARSHGNLGVLLWNNGREKEAKQEYRQTIALLEKLAADSPAVPQYRSDVALIHNNLSALLEKTGEWEEAEPVSRRAIDLYSKLAADSPAVPEYQSNLAMSHMNLGEVLDNTGRQAEAEQVYRRAIALEGKLAAESPTVPRYRSFLGWSHKDLGRLLSHSGRSGEAEQEYDQAIASFEKLVADFPSVPEYQQQLASSRTNLADLMQAAGRWAEAEREYRLSIAVREKLADADSQNELAWILATNSNPRLRDPQLALRVAKRAVEQSPQAGGYQNTLGVAHYRVGDWKSAVEALEKSMQLGAGGDPFDWLFLAMAHWRKGDKDRARQWYDKAVQWMERNKSQDEEMRRFRAEAAALLGVTDHPKSTGEKGESAKERSRP